MCGALLDQHAKSSVVEAEEAYQEAEEAESLRQQMEATSLSALTEVEMLKEELATLHRQVSKLQQQVSQKPQELTAVEFCLKIAMSDLAHESQLLDEATAEVAQLKQQLNECQVRLLSKDIEQHVQSSASAARHSMDIKGDGVVSKAEFLASGGTLTEFAMYDADGNGVLDAHEFEQQAADQLCKSWEMGSDSSEDFSSDSFGVGITQEQLEREKRQQIISEAIALDMTHREGKDETSLVQLLTKQLSPAIEADIEAGKRQE